MENETVYTIATDDDGYYKFGDGNLVEVTEIPNVYPLDRLRAYKYDEETKSLVLDKERLKEIDTEIGYVDESDKPSIEERLEAIEGLMLDMLSADGGEL